MDLSCNVLWQVSLSNGETFYEGKGNYIEYENQPSPWQRLNKYIIEKGVDITSLSLYTKDGRTFNLPSSGNNPKFRPFQLADKPLDYNVVRYLAREHNFDNGNLKKLKISDHFTVAEAIYPDYKLQLWVDEMNTNNSWVLVVK